MPPTHYSKIIIRGLTSAYSNGINWKISFIFSPIGGNLLDLFKALAQNHFKKLANFSWELVKSNVRKSGNELITITHPLQNQITWVLRFENMDPDLVKRKIEIFVGLEKFQNLTHIFDDNKPTMMTYYYSPMYYKM